MPLDPFSLGTMAVVARQITRHNTCPVCNKVKVTTNWAKWTCCQVWQCPDCAAETERTKSCHNCGHGVK